MEFNNIKICLTENIYLNNRLKHLIGDKVKNVYFISDKNRYFLDNIGDKCSAKAQGVILMNVFDMYDIKRIKEIYRDIAFLKDVSDKDIFICTTRKDIRDILVGIFTEGFYAKNIEVENFTSDKLGRMMIKESV